LIKTGWISITFKLKFENRVLKEEIKQGIRVSEKEIRKTE